MYTVHTSCREEEEEASALSSTDRGGGDRSCDDNGSDRKNRGNDGATPLPLFPPDTPPPPPPPPLRTVPTGAPLLLLFAVGAGAGAADAGAGAEDLPRAGAAVTFGLLSEVVPRLGPAEFLSCRSDRMCATMRPRRGEEKVEAQPGHSRVKGSRQLSTRNALCNTQREAHPCACTRTQLGRGMFAPTKIKIQTHAHTKNKKNSCLSV